VLLAPACAVCEAVLERPGAGCICEECWATVTPFTPPLCAGCGTPLPSWRISSVDGGRCPRCRRAGRLVERAAAVGPYEGVLRDILHVFKYGRRPTLAAPLGERLRRQGVDLLDAADGVVPVPLHPRRRRERGFNQAELLARELGRPVLQALARTRETATQASLPEAQRHRNVRDAFARTGAEIRGLSLVLVDDVATTGATLEACARVLMAGGAREVAALTVARAERRLP
jgi:ComF family protein